MELYDVGMSPNCRKVRVFAAELGVPLKLIPLDPTKGETRSAEYRAKNPNGKVPTLDDDGFLLWESGAILCYLASKHPEKKLIPTDPRGRAVVDQWIHWWTSHLESAVNLLASERWLKPMFGMPGNDPSICAEAEKSLARFLPVLDGQLGKGPWVLGADLSVVDFLMAPMLAVAPNIGASFEKYPNIAAWLERMKSRESWKTA